MPKLNPILCEFFGTLLLVAVVSTAAAANLAVGGQALTGEALANGLVVGVVVTATLHVSGGQINPAVTIGLLSIGRLSKMEAAVFIVAQVLGAAAGGLIVHQLLPAELGEQCAYGTPQIKEMLEPWQGLGIEILATFLLGLSICGTVLHPRTPHTNGLGIGAAVALLVFTFGPFTGAAMNPARQLGSALAASHWADHWLYWLAPTVGAVLAMQVFTRILKDPKE